MAGPHVIVIPDEAAERWVEVPCDCDGRDDPHSNDFRLLDDFLCVAALDEDGIIYKWRVEYSGSGRVANGYADDMAGAKRCAEITAHAMIKDRAAYYDRHPHDKPILH